MALDFMSDINDRFMEDNLLSSEDWGDPGFYNGGSIDDLVNHNGLHSAEDIQVEDLSSSDTPSSNLTSDDLDVDLARAWLGITDEGQAQELNGYPIKNEPLSPPPSSESSDTSSESSQVSQVLQNGNANHVHIKLESPPLTPPRDPPSDGPTPLAGQQQAFFTIANGNLPNGVTKSLAKGVINGSKKGIAIAPKPTVNGTIQLPLVPKLEGVHVASTVAVTPSAKPTVTVKHIPAVRPPIVVKPNNSSPFTTANGSCAPPPAKQAKVVPMPIHPSIPSPTQESIAVFTQACPQNVDVKVWKRQQRMIKNRESACLSRKKKKEYVQELEQKALSMEQEVFRLRSENKSLRTKMEALVKENSSLKRMQSSVFSSPARTATCLLGIVLIIGFNLAPFSLFSQEGISSEFDTGHHAGRALLGFTENQKHNTSQLHGGSRAKHASIHDIMEDASLWASIANQSASTNDVALATMQEIRYLLPQGNYSCSNEMNITDTIRLADVLQYWAKRQLNEQKKSKTKEKLAEKKKRRQRYQAPYRRYSAAPTLHVESEERALQIYDHFFQKSYDNLLEALNRRDDTFYVVSFRNDHLLLPATAHNNTRRPKMSLVMPTVSANESMWNTPKDHISMMQIDCEVIDTRVVHLKDQGGSQQPVVNNDTTYGSNAPAAAAAAATAGAPASHSERSSSQHQNVAAAFVGQKADRKIGYKYHPRNLTNPAVSP